ncbi:MAG: UDP-N-acetylmuramoyl-L-alanine--D-glutamate ligase [Candidatus Caenarcaniphilales bacterium]|nr:UDP-N-acetylmuramoyl-L-alanine--D-glutamate ligase [Candidatus Caenarcaniphilales bacterium]
MSYTILGLGISGLAALEYLVAQGAYPILVSESRLRSDFDLETIALIDRLEGKVEFEFGGEHTRACLLYENLVVSPGMPIDSQILKEARSKGKTILTEIDLALKCDAERVEKLIGITGTNGKSTTTALIAHLLGVAPCGNIGTPLTLLLKNNPSQKTFVCEISSFQLAHSWYFHPQIALITNITPDHISWHGSWEAYQTAKAKIATYQTTQDWLILPEELHLPGLNQAPQRLMIRSEGEIEPTCTNAAWVDEDGILWLKVDGKIDRLIERAESILPGRHNTANLLFASAAAYLAGLPLETLRERLRSFAGLEHRLEFIGEYHSKVFFNDSKATNPESTIVALEAFSEPVTWIAGGRDKLTDLTALSDIAKRKAAQIVLYGEAKGRFKEALHEAEYKGELIMVENLDAALRQNLKARIILFSPACASFDQFKNFEERGAAFKSLVHKLYAD